MGGMQALTVILSRLPAHFPASILIVQHLSRHRPSRLPPILSRQTALIVREAHDGDHLRPGIVFIAPSNRHLLLKGEGILSLSDGERVNYSRPAIDPLFESAAASLRERVIAVILTGSNSDGARGAAAVKLMGGVVIAQDEATSEYFTMPEAAINEGVVDEILPLTQIANRLIALTITITANNN